MDGKPLLETQEVLNELQDACDEFYTLSEYTETDLTDLTDSQSQILHFLQSSYNKITELHVYLLSLSKIKASDITQFNNLIDKYRIIYQSLQSNNAIDKDTIIDYQLLDNDITIINKPDEFKSTNTLIESSTKLTTNPKSVRFKNNIVESSPSVLYTPYKDNIDDELTTSKSLKPYKDSLFETSEVGDINNDDNSSEIDNPTIDMSNKQIFIHNQHQFDYQDNELDHLHSSIKQQRQISMHINTEVSDQFVILNDLEQQVDSSNNRLIRSNNKLQKYRKMLKKRGDWMCILILIFVLLFILIFIK
jgi:hypothetical protein